MHHQCQILLLHIVKVRVVPCVHGDLLPAEQQTAVLACLDDAVVWRGATEACWIGPHDWQFAHIDTAAGHYAAVSMFVPQSIYTTQAARCWYGDLNQAFQSTAWYAACGFSSTGW